GGKLLLVGHGLSSDRIVAGAGCDRHPAQLGEAVDAGLAAEAAVTGIADAAEGHLRLVRDGRSVDVADARLDPPRDPEAARGVAGEDRGRQAVSAVVG